VLSVVTWGAAGQVVAPLAMLDALGRLVDDPIDRLKPLAAYLVDAYGADNARAMAKSFAHALHSIVDSGGDVSRSRATLVTCPALLITGTYDQFCPPDLVREMAEAIPGGEFLEAPGAGHDVHQSQPDWLVSTVVDWLGDH
jgi:valacyclovir hydrolase